MAEAGVNIGKIRSKLDDQEAVNILNRLTPIDYSSQQNDCIKTRQAGIRQ
ncbi:hypothetical protein ANO14919_069400 [Xylariales sp. No.14919]|nr:hypothetical protein ANO14919_069400 [Xylariales sp. No.14919]